MTNRVFRPLKLVTYLNCENGGRARRLTPHNEAIKRVPTTSSVLYACMFISWIALISNTDFMLDIPNDVIDNHSRK